MFDNVFDVMIKLLMPSVYNVQFWIFSMVRWSFLSSSYLKLVWLRMCLYASSVIPLSLFSRGVIAEYWCASESSFT